MTSNFEYYRIFYYVAKYGNLTRAASALNTSQPAVTRTIHKLEDDLGCRLFIRSKMGMELTAEGQQFFEYVSAGCAQFFKGESESEGQAEPGKGYDLDQCHRDSPSLLSVFRQWRSLAGSTEGPFSDLK